MICSPHKQPFCHLKTITLATAMLVAAITLAPIIITLIKPSSTKSFIMQGRFVLYSTAYQTILNNDKSSTSEMRVRVSLLCCVEQSKSRCWEVEGGSMFCIIILNKSRGLYKPLSKYNVITGRHFAKWCMKSSIHIITSILGLVSL